MVGSAVVTILGIKLKTVIWFLIAIVLGLIFSMVMWPQWWRKYYQKRKDAREALAKGKKPLVKERKGLNIWIIVAMVLIFVCGIIIGSMLGFRQAVDHIPQPVLASSCAAYSQCALIDCENIMSEGCPGCVCSYCGDPKYNGAVRIEIPYPVQ